MRRTSCSSLSDQTGIPSGRFFVESFFSIQMRLAGVHRYRSKRSASMTESIFARDMPSAVSAVAPGVNAPLLAEIRANALRYSSRLNRCR
jgi:hypothetical protein